MFIFCYYKKKHMFLVLEATPTSVTRSNTHNDMNICSMNWMIQIQIVVLNYTLVCG